MEKYSVSSGVVSSVVPVSVEGIGSSETGASVPVALFFAAKAAAAELDFVVSDFEAAIEEFTSLVDSL